MPAPCAIVLTGGVAKGAFHAGVLKSFAEHGVIPSVLVGASAGAMNGAYAAKLIAEERFTPYWVEKVLYQTWLHQVSLQKLWSGNDPQENSLRSLVGDVQFNWFMLRNIMDWISPMRLRELLKLRFTSVLGSKHFRQQMDASLTKPRKVEREVHFAASITSLTGRVATYAGQPLISYGDYVSFHLHPDQDQDSLEDIFSSMRSVVRASSSFPGVFPPVPLVLDGRVDHFIDGGLVKNAPFGRAVKLDPEVRTIFLVSCTPITQPTSGRIDNMLTIIDQVYKIVINKDLANDFRKIQQINERIEKLHRLLERDDNGEFLENRHNLNMIDLAGFKSMADFLSKRTVEIKIIEPALDLEGDPFAGLYRTDRISLLQGYLDLGYQVGDRVLKNYLAAEAAKA